MVAVREGEEEEEEAVVKEVEKAEAKAEKASSMTALELLSVPIKMWLKKTTCVRAG
jgi:hypothetical protein